MPRVTITVPDSNSQPYRFQLDREIVRLGRGSDNDIVIDSGSVSTNHAEMRRVVGGYELHDSGSTNGLKLDGVRYPVVPLLHGSTVYLGDVAFDFSLTDEEQEMLAFESPQVVGTPLPPPDVPVSTQPMGHAVQPRPVPKRQVIRVEQDNGGGFFMTFMLIVFALLAFAAGLMIRHEKETGGSLIQHIKAKYAGNAPAADNAAPVEPAAPAPLPIPPPPPPIAPPMPQGDLKLPAPPPPAPAPQ